MTKAKRSLILNDVPQYYNARIKTYPDGRQCIAVFTKDIFNPDKWEEWKPDEDEAAKPFIDTESTDNSIREYTKDGIRLDNLKRSREKVFDIAFCNVDMWQYMVTLTLDSEKINRYDADEVRKKFKKWLDNSAARKNLNYILVAEPHKDGAIHFHGLFSGGLGYEFSGLKDSNGRKIYNIKDYPFGFARAVPIDKGTQSNCCKYITKYMTKDFTKIFGNMYWAGGRQLQREVKTEYCHIDFDSVNAEPREITNGGYYVKYLETGVSI